MTPKYESSAMIRIFDSRALVTIRVSEHEQPRVDQQFRRAMSALEIDGSIRFDGDRAVVGFYLPGRHSDPELDALSVVHRLEGAE